jgi:uncharacterized membrane protein
MRTLLENYGDAIVTAFCVLFTIMFILLLIPLFGDLESTALGYAIGLQ